MGGRRGEGRVLIKGEKSSKVMVGFKDFSPLMQYFLLNLRCV